MPQSVLTAIQDGDWEYEPKTSAPDDYDPTSALPGTEDKLTVMAKRVKEGLPLWHPADRLGIETSED